MKKNRHRREIEELGWGHGGISLVISLAKDSDRACALVAGELVTDWLEKYLRMRFTKNKMSKDAQFSLVSEWNSPLLNFAVRIKVLRAFGHIGDQTQKALTAIKDIRNACAHHPGTIDFTSDELREELRVLREFKELVRPKLTLDWNRQPGANSPPIVTAATR